MNRLAVYVKRIGGIVHVFKDEACTNLFVRYSQGKGPRSAPFLTLDCYNWRCVYLPDEGGMGPLSVSMGRFLGLSVSFGRWVIYDTGPHNSLRREWSHVASATNRRNADKTVMALYVQDREDFERTRLTCPECGETVWDTGSGHKLPKCWNSDGHESNAPLSFDTM